jgi:hypothetical protein
MWVLWFTVFLTMFVNAIVFGHITPRALEVLMYAVAAGCGACGAVSLWRSFRRANNPGS